MLTFFICFCYICMQDLYVKFYNIISSTMNRYVFFGYNRNRNVFAIKFSPSVKPIYRIDAKREPIQLGVLRHS